MDAAIESRLREVERWQAEHGGQCTVRNTDQDTINKAVWKRLDVHLNRIHTLEKRVALITGGATTIGVIIGNLIQLLF